MGPNTKHGILSQQDLINKEKLIQKCTENHKKAVCAANRIKAPHSEFVSTILAKEF